MSAIDRLHDLDRWALCTHCTHTAQQHSNSVGPCSICPCLEFTPDQEALHEAMMIAMQATIDNYIYGQGMQN